MQRSTSTVPHGVHQDTYLFIIIMNLVYIPRYSYEYMLGTVNYFIFISRYLT